MSYNMSIFDIVLLSICIFVLIGILFFWLSIKISTYRMFKVINNEEAWDEVLSLYQKKNSGKISKALNKKYERLFRTINSKTVSTDIEHLSKKDREQIIKVLNEVKK